MSREAGQPENRRGTPRAAPQTPIEVHFSAGRIDGTGMLEDLSLSGCQIASASACPAPGTKVELALVRTGKGEPVQALAEVVRSTAKGFAVRFQRVDQRLRDFLTAALPE